MFEASLKFLSLVALVAMVALARPASADDLSYDDPGLHYRAPDGWQRVPIGDAEGNEGAPVAVFALKANKSQPRTVTITIAQDDESLTDFVNAHKNKLRQGSGDNGFVVFLHSENTKLANGMPVVYFVWTFSSDSAVELKSYEYLFVDGQRSIDVDYTGYASDVGDADAAATLSTLYAVAYPRKHADSP
jgi:hypothetical protein